MKNPFEGDGREKIQPVFPLVGTVPSAIRRGTANQIISMFQRTGISCHSAMGATAWVPILWCYLNKEPCEIFVDPGVSIHVCLKGAWGRRF